MNKLIKQSFLLLTAVILIHLGCAASKVNKENYSGKYYYKITTPMGEQTGFFTLSREGKVYTGKIHTQQGSTDLNIIRYRGNTITAHFCISYCIEMKFNINGNVIEGTASAEGFVIPFKAVKE